MPDYSVKLKNGVIVLTPELAEAMVKSLKKALIKDPNLKKQFKKDPNQVLADRGFPKTFQNEFLLNVNRSAKPSAADCVFTSCSGLSSTGCAPGKTD